MGALRLILYNRIDIYECTYTCCFLLRGYDFAALAESRRAFSIYSLFTVCCERLCQNKYLFRFIEYNLTSRARLYLSRKRLQGNTYHFVNSAKKCFAPRRYAIMIASLILILLAFWMTSTRSLRESFLAAWAALLVTLLSIGGTMVMRKYHNSMAVGFFLGAIVAMAQLFFVLSFM